MRDSSPTEIATEQSFVDQAYSRLDKLRQSYRANQREVEAQGAWGSPQARTERDAMAAHYGDKAARLEQIEDRLVFGRIDTEDGEKLHIGRAGLRKESGERLLVDWRAPAARRFYQATPAQPEGIVRRRHIGTHLREVVSLEDELLDSQAAQEEGMHFQGEGALMSALARAREGRMGDILATIQSEQDAVIRSSSKGLLIVQGGPGTGKTAVALHRAAYLLYTERERLERSGVLVVGPTKVFMRYIEKVLPSLGETGVISLTLGELLPGIVATAVDTPAVNQAKGSLGWIPILKAAVRSYQRIPAEDVLIEINGKRASLSREDVAQARTKARRSGKPHNEARDGFALELIEVLVKQLSDNEDDPDTLGWWREEVRADLAARRAINLCWLPWRPTDLLEKLYSQPDFLARFSGVSATGYPQLSPAQFEMVARPKGSPWTVSDIPLLDELEELLGYSQAMQARGELARARQEELEVERARQAIEGQNLGGGIVSAQMLAQQARGEQDWKPLTDRARQDRTWAYGHIVVDEAQDLTPMMWHILLRRCPSQSFTVVGDLDQARGLQRPSSWPGALGPAARALTDERVLTISYRTPRAVTELAQEILAELGEPVRYPLTSAREVPDAIAFTHVEDVGALEGVARATIAAEEAQLDQNVGPGAGRLAVIVSDERGEAWGADRLGNSGIDQRLSVLTAGGAKGLEFDTVILVEPEEILKQGPGDLFVALTRCTTRLQVIYSSPLSPAWSLK